MGINGPRGVAVDAVRHAVFIQQVLKDVLTCRGPADVAPADEEDTEGLFSRHGGHDGG